jgi:hypothetical protein
LLNDLELCQGIQQSAGKLLISVPHGRWGNLSLSVGRLQRQKELRAGFLDVLSEQEHGL